MILRMPEYCREFRCIADKCTDSCCIGWEIDIDSKTSAFYESIGGGFGKKLKKNITVKSPKSFILGEHDRCPFLNERNLCEIIINLGEEHLCQICSDHPRYYEWFDGLTEGGIGLCCEEAARIILSQTEPLSYWDRETSGESAEDYDTELFDCLFSARQKIITHLQQCKAPISQRLCDVLYYTKELQYRTDNGDFSVPDIKSASFANISAKIQTVLDFLITLEPIDDKWIPYLKSCAEMHENIKLSGIKLSERLPETSQYLRNIAVYFVWRYFLKGVFSGEFLSAIKLMAVSTAVIGYLFACSFCENGRISLGSCAEIAKNYSKEIEYCTENLDALADVSYEKDFFSAESIAGLLLNII